jgi:hypothetical protein
LENNYKKLSVPTTILAAMELRIALPTKMKMQEKERDKTLNRLVFKREIYFSY